MNRLTRAGVRGGAAALLLYLAMVFAGRSTDLWTLLAAATATGIAVGLLVMPG